MPSVCTDSSGAPDKIGDSRPGVNATENPLDLGMAPSITVQFVVKHLCYFNECLEMYNTLLERNSLYYGLRTLCVREKVSRLPKIGDAAALLGHKDIQQWVKARFLIERNRNEENESAGVFRIDQKEMTYDGRLRDGGQLRSLETYKGQKVLVDWYYPAKLKVKQTSKRDTTAFLSHDVGPLNLCILRCAGYIESTRDDIGYAYVLPSGITQIELVHWLRKAGSVQSFPPDLDGRFKLANAIARTVFGMHTLNWLHENISPRNIVICSHVKQVGTTLCYPYLLGFGIHRHDVASDYEVPLEQRGADEDFEYYRHSELRESFKLSEPGQWPFKPSYDIYSLGIVLLEIGLWQTLREKSKGPSYNYHGLTIAPLARRNPHQMLTEEALKDLRAQTGHLYTNAVIACLDGSFDEIWAIGIDDDPQQLRDHLRMFQEDIINPLVACST